MQPNFQTPVPVLPPLAPKPGEALYLTVRQAVRHAVDTGLFVPGSKLPSTKAISDQLDVSLVTVHRALQELVGVGVLRRGQGRGTYVHEAYQQRARLSTGLRFGLVFHAECSLADSYHGLILEGVRQGADEYGADLVLLHFSEDWRKECQGFLYVNPFADQLARSPIIHELADQSERNARAGANGTGRTARPVMVVGATFDRAGVSCVDTDNRDIARQAVEHLVGLGHRRIVYVGGGDHIANNADRYLGFMDACREYGVEVNESDIDRGNGWKFEPAQEAQFRTLLKGPEKTRPTAVFAAGYYYALGVYSIAQSQGISIPSELSVVGVDDPASAEHLSPPLTTVRQPLMEMGKHAVRGLFDAVGVDRPMVQMTKLRGELVVRKSSAVAARTDVAALRRASSVGVIAGSASSPAPRGGSGATGQHRP